MRERALKAGRLERALWAWRVAQVMDCHHYTPAEVFALTPLQLGRLCFHPRDRDGSLRRPGPPRPARGAMPYVPDAATLDEALARLEKYHREVNWLPDDEKRRAADRLRARWGAKGG